MAVMIVTGCSGSRPAQHAGGKRVSGRLDPKVIQAVVRGHYGQFRACYEAGLSRDPYLEGRVAVRFVIALDGSVPHASIVPPALDTDTSVAKDSLGHVPVVLPPMPDTEVAKCVARLFYGMHFPEPDGGIVSVVYPVMFSAGEPSTARTKKSD